jgi:hypothetical protein
MHENANVKKQIISLYIYLSEFKTNGILMDNMQIGEAKFWSPDNVRQFVLTCELVQNQTFL